MDTFVKKKSALYYLCNIECIHIRFVVVNILLVLQLIEDEGVTEYFKLWMCKGGCGFKGVFEDGGGWAVVCIQQFYAVNHFAFLYSLLKPIAFRHKSLLHCC